MTRVSEIPKHWFGLCRKPPLVYTSQADIVNLPESAYEGLPDGGGGGSDSIRRGIGAALSGMRTLNRNRQLLWFTLLAGLVLAGNTIGQSAFYYISWNLHMQLDRIICQFLIEFTTLFCLVLLLAGLFLSISSKKESSASFLVDLAGAKKHLKSILLWSFVLALAGMLLDIISFYFPVWFPHELGFLYVFGHFNSFLFSTLSQFPFNLTLRWDLFTEIPGYGGRTVLFWIYPGLMETLVFSAINLLLLILTLFVMPLIVLEQKTLSEAVAGSFAMMKKTWVETASCAVFLGVVVFGVFLTYLLVDAAHRMFAPLEVIYYHPTVTWISLGLLYDLALFGVVFVVATVGGIAALDLYTSAKNRQIAGPPEPKPHS